MADDFGQELVARLPRLRRFAVVLTRSRDLADDLVQVTCEKALASRGSFQPGTNLDAWLFRIMRNAWIDRARSLNARGEHVTYDTAGALVGQDGAAAAESRLMINATANAIGHLPDDQREVLVLVCVEELSYKAAAEVLDIPVGTVMSRLARARAKLAEQLGINRGADRSPPERGNTP